MHWARRAVRWALEGLLLALMLGILSLAALAHLLPATGHPVFAIGSGSMTPTIPVGSVVVLTPGSNGVRVGDVVTMRLDDGAVFSHRVVRLAALNGAPYIGTKGDANRTADPALTPLSHVLGRVVLVIPAAGYLMAGLGSPLGAATVLLAALTLFAALWFLDDEADERAPQRASGPGEPSGASAARPSTQPTDPRLFANCAPPAMPSPPAMSSTTLPDRSAQPAPAIAIRARTGLGSALAR